MLIHQCDRCGTTFDLDYTSRKAYVVHKVNSIGLEYSAYDLCPKCQEELNHIIIRFMGHFNGRKKEN